ncbi:MAG TPA: ApaG domain [Opitutaceae bacterium]
MTEPSHSLELPGLEVVLDKLEYLFGKGNIPPETPHVFIYHLTIHNRADRALTLLGRKWIVIDESGNRSVIEGEKIVGKTPHLEPGESFSYNSFHLTGGDATAEGSFHGVDEQGMRVHVRIPSIPMRVPRK